MVVRWCLRCAGGAVMPGLSHDSGSALVVALFACQLVKFLSAKQRAPVAAQIRINNTWCVHNSVQFTVFSRDVRATFPLCVYVCV